MLEGGHDKWDWQWIFFLLKWILVISFVCFLAWVVVGAAVYGLWYVIKHLQWIQG